MRNFYYRAVKKASLIYVCFFLVLSYRLFYNENYYAIHDEIETSMSDKQVVYPGGEIIGIYTECDGIFVIDTCEIETKDGDFINPTDNLIKTGDYIVAINDIKMEYKEDMISLVKNCDGEDLKLTVSRNDEITTITITPVLAKNGEYMLGIWVKDDLAGVGTLTYITEDGDFAALGHGMGDGETNELLEVKDGDLYNAKVLGIEKGEKGNPGEIKGIIYYGLIHHIGLIDENSGKGIFGSIDKEDLATYLTSNEAYEVVKKQEIEVGTAQIISDISGEKELYDIEITYIDYLAENSNKGLHIKVTDTELLELTGGIIQGMSGSPIIQNGKLVGAVTHVLVNDPTKGYGIFIENMLNE